jgi:hypothetical protein
MSSRQMPSSTVDAQLNGDAQAVDEGLIFRYVVRGREMKLDRVLHMYPKRRDEDEPRVGALLHQ